MSFSATRCCIAIAISLVLANAPAMAQQSNTQYEINLPEQSLADSLRALGKAAHVNIVFDPGDVHGKRASVLAGQYTPEEALQRLLAGSGLNMLRTAGGSYAVVSVQLEATEANRMRNDPNTFDSVVVYGKVQGLAAMRVPTELREIPQSVSVITQETLRQQNAHDLAGALNWATGITLYQQGTGESQINSRGFAIGQIHVDGGAPISVGQRGASVDDMAEYDHLEVLRGADGLFGGAGNPGGTFNLVRKQAQSKPQLRLAATLGTWDYYHLQLDATGPLGFDDALRGRVVMSSTEQHYFYDRANRQSHKLYGTLSYDLSPSTVLTVGGSVDQSNKTGMTAGLPGYSTGADPHLPRSTALIFPWIRDRAHNVEAFAQLEQRFGDRWKLKLGVTGARTRSNNLDAQNRSSINPVTHLLGTPMGVVYATDNSRYLMADATLTGGFDWNGRRQDITVGLDYRGTSGSGNSRQTVAGGPPLDPWNYDPTAYLPLAAGPSNPVVVSANDVTTKSIGGYASLRLRPWDGWSVILGGRDNYARAVSTLSYRLDLGSAGFLPIFNLRSTSVSGGVVTPYAGVVYDIGSHYSLYASYADIYQPAGVNKTFAGELIGPVHGVNMEAGIKAAWYGGRLNGSFAVYRIKQNNQPVYDPNHPANAAGTCCFLAADNTSKGVDAELVGRLTSNWQWSGGYTFNRNSLHANLPGEGQPLSTITPKHLLKLWTNYRLPGVGRRWSVGGGLRAQTANYVNGYLCPQINALGRCTVLLQPFHSKQGFYTVVTLRTAYEINAHWAVALNIDNLFDRTYYQAIGSPNSSNWYGTPRNLMLTINGKL